MSKKGTLVVFRHGETYYSKKHWLTGLRDIGLTPHGEDQGRAMGKPLRGFVFDKAYSSTLSRAFNTTVLGLEASGSNNHLKKPDGTWDIEQRPELVEGNAGDFTGRDKATDPEILAWPHRYDVPLPNGESDEQMVERVRPFYEQELLPRLARGETVAVGAHAGIMQAFEIVTGVKPVPIEDIWSHRGCVPNAEPVVYEYDGGRLTNHYRLG